MFTIVSPTSATVSCSEYPNNCVVNDELSFTPGEDSTAGIEKKLLLQLFEHSPIVNCVTVPASNGVEDTTGARLCSSHFGEEDRASHKGSQGQKVWGQIRKRKKSSPRTEGEEDMASQSDDP